MNMLQGWGSGIMIKLCPLSHRYSHIPVQANSLCQRLWCGFIIKIQRLYDSAAASIFSWFIWVVSKLTFHFLISSQWVDIATAKDRRLLDTTAVSTWQRTGLKYKSFLFYLLRILCNQCNLRWSRLLEIMWQQSSVKQEAWKWKKNLTGGHFQKLLIQCNFHMIIVQ